MKVLCVVGARPNFIKIAPLFKEFKKYQKIKPILVHTGQHYDYKMSGAFFKELNIPKPNYNLGIKAGLHGEQTGKTMIEFEKVCLKEKPDLVIVVGDVNATLAGALVAAKLHIPVAHIEAGLRSGDMNMPEEINRILTDHISDILFCPTPTAIKNLKKENIIKNVYNTGDLMYDVFLKNIKIAQKKSKILKILDLKPKAYCLLTIHRASNVDNPENLKKILEAIQESNEKVIFPIHPRTQKQLKKLKLKIEKCKLKIITPVGYLDMLWLEKNAKKILTDSGGVQKEAYFAKTPCITLRDTIEWIETRKYGWNILVGNNKKKIIKAIKFFNPKEKQINCFGDGRTAKKIVKNILNKLK
ncbi:MAG: UDP-N-acetylglucosamine 2-epimerase (non-hydrolyzing) [Patescibacteria group bacterium]|nr:UDP-N-acetylglucosamine 2-epimerase (non-hydrolyzing) [Patescibacteria group bacterium]MDD5534495.1 UDP-N-acetylglucosamine 2-epimerase (non-hydrolyzing) [Patescibacteria group bacterium]